jgi:UDP-2-acetamido-3-amino-2,3-dideoxy-glucuronate N-acetyltransferase
MSVVSSTAFIHNKALIDDGATIGAETRVWGFTHILSGAIIGQDCNICEQVFVENDVVVGDRVTIKSGVQLWDGVSIESDVFIGPNVTFTNDKFPRSKLYLDDFAKTIVKKGASLGANSTILPGISIGSRAMIGAGAVVTKSVPPGAIVIGNPAKITGYVDTKIHQKTLKCDIADALVSTIKGVKLLNFNHISDIRGNLTEMNFKRDIPFLPKRVFLVEGVPSSSVRGEHAHKICKQLLVCTHGRVSVIVDDGANREEFALTSPSHGIYIPPMVWGVQYKYSADAVLMVYASHSYDVDDYIRDYDDFLKIVNNA